MNTAHLHLLLNHLPIIGILIGTLVLIAAFLLKGNRTVKQTALSIIAIAALSAIPAFLTGEGAEEVVEGMSGVTKLAIEEHEEAGRAFLIVASILGLLAILTLVADRFKNKLAQVFYIVVLIGGVGTSFLAQQAGASGGKVRHTELQNVPAGSTAVGQREAAEVD